MRFLTRIVIATCLVTAPVTAVAEANRPQSAKIVTIEISPDRSELNLLRSRGFQILGVSYELGMVQIMLQGSQEMTLARLGLKVAAEEIVNMKLAPDEEYLTYDDMRAKAEDIAREHPDIMKIESIGQSLDGRDIVAIKISDNVAMTEESEPAILFNAMHHAREVMTVEVAMDIVSQLTSRYQNDEDVKNWVNDNEIWIVPMVNPDGNHKVWTEYAFWRKNTRDGHGVDINRNYPYAWGTCNGSSDIKSLDDYRGESPASEPETRALMGLVERIRPVFNISYHSYSELVIYPFGCRGKRSDNRVIVESLGEELAQKLIRDSGQGHYDPGTSWELLYNVDGGDIDWMHHEFGVIPFVVEVNSMSQGFQPNYSWVEPTVNKMRPGWQLLLNKLKESGVRGTVLAEDGALVTGGVVRAVALYDQNSVSTWPIRPDGTFHAVLKPGMYRLESVHSGKTKITHVIVGGKRLDLEAGVL